MASMILANSPPEATFESGLRASPTFADIKNRTRSNPVSAASCGVNSQTKRIFGISSCRSSSQISVSISFAA